MNECELCHGPLDSYAKLNESDYCTGCTSPIGSLFEVLNYLKVPLQRRPLVAQNPRTGEPEEIPWPHPKCPALWHDKAVRHFHQWGEIVSEFKKLKNIKYFDMTSLRSLVEFVREKLREKGMNGTDEEIAIIRRSEVLKMIRHELSRGTVAELLSSKQEQVIEQEIVVESAAPSLLGRHREK